MKHLRTTLSPSGGRVALYKNGSGYFLKVVANGIFKTQDIKDEKEAKTIYRYYERRIF